MKSANQTVKSRLRSRSGFCLRAQYGRVEMSSLAANPVLASVVACTDDEIIVFLSDGRRLAVPIVWFPRLAKASPSERADYELLGNGEGVHWSRVDEDISVFGLLAGKPSTAFRCSS